MERTLVLIKPDVVERNLIGKILTHYESNGLKIAALKMMQADRDIAVRHYEEHQGRDFFEPLIEYITRSPLVALVLEGHDAIAYVREINGATNPAEAERNTVRDLYGLSIRENSVHSSDAQETAEKEIAIWFGENA